MLKCKCGCGQDIITKNKYISIQYIRGHNNKGKHIEHSGQFKKGHKINCGRKRTIEERTAISNGHKGQIPWNKGKHPLCLQGENHPMYGKTHSVEAREKISNGHKGKPAWSKGKKLPNRTGELNPTWKGGVTSYNKMERKRFRKTVLQKVLERDSYTCQMCGEIGGFLQVDHIQPWSDCIEGRFNIENCRTLCMRCHYYITFGREMPNNITNWGHGLLKVEA